MIYLAMAKIAGTREYGDVAVNARNKREARSLVRREVERQQELGVGETIASGRVQVYAIERYGEGLLYDKESYNDEFWTMFKDLEPNEALIWDWGT